MQLTWISFLLLLLVGCSNPKVQAKNYAVVSSFNEAVLETESREEAYEAARYLTSMGRVFISKPTYFVVEKPRKDAD